MLALLILLSPAALVLAYILWTFAVLYLRQARSPLRTLPGPPSPSFFLGHLRELHDQENTGLLARWEAEHGSTLVYKGFIGGQRLLTTDARAVAHILGHPDDFPKPDFVRATLASMAAGHDGLIVVEGEQHRKQRKILTPAFSSPHIKSLSPVFWRKAVELRDIFLDIIASSTAASSNHTTAPRDPLAPAPDAVPRRATGILPNPFAGFTPGKKSPARSSVRGAGVQEGLRRRGDGGAKSEEKTPAPKVDVLAWLARATLDVIGEAGFGYYFNTLSVAHPKTSGAEARAGEENELARAFGVIFTSARAFRVILVLQVWFPVLRRFARENAAMKAARATMRRIGTALIRERQGAVLEKGAASTEGRDLLSVMVRSNMSSEERHRLSENEILCQISTFLAAGHETTASGLTWTLYALARAPAVQAKLRAELLAHPLPTPTPSPSPFPTADPTPAAETINTILALPYLDAVIRESLRAHAPVTSTMRVATRDTAIPLSRPILLPDADNQESIGRTQLTSVRVNKGDIVMVPLQAMNKKRSVWGEDAEVFRPERWLEDSRGGGEGVESLRGLWGGVLTFGSALGNRSCIGYRFALNEMKIFLYVLLRDLEFSIDPAVVVEKRVNVVTRPAVQSEPDVGNQMPLRIRRVDHTLHTPHAPQPQNTSHTHTSSPYTKVPPATEPPSSPRTPT